MLKSRLSYLLLLLAAVAFWLFDGREISTWLLLILLILPVLSLLTLPVSVLCLRVTFACNKGVFGKKEDIPISVIIKNKSVIPISRLTVGISYRNSFCAESGRSVLLIPVSALYEETLFCRISSEHYGKLSISLEECIVRDILGLFSWKKKLSGGVEVLVMPPFSAEKGGASVKGLSGNESGANKSGDDPTELLQLRGYRPGDRLNRIHWKLSSRTPEFIVKEYSGEENLKYFFLVDLPEDEAERDGVIEAFCILLSAASQGGLSPESAWLTSSGLNIQKSEALYAEDMARDFISTVVADNEPKALEAYLSVETKDKPDGLFYINSHSVNTMALSEECCKLTVFSCKDRESEIQGDTTEWIKFNPNEAYNAILEWSK